MIVALVDADRSARDTASSTPFWSNLTTTGSSSMLTR